ncbi:amidase [Acidisoma cellulosilytica]|uniref:Amidase n=1 Tax=Acidisoma cellulosilyticum TaxID=2802395 RepID=A0A963Z1E0_9PROT|nr:amidase [Acidisoma cellulosilyticum]MCB8880212.1 amidase [Acidisoma cellulosilyticum]
MSASDLYRLTATDLLAGYARRDFSPVDVTRACLDRIAATNPVLNAFCLVDEASALASAQASEARWQKGESLGVLDGVPTSIKDLFQTKGWPTLCGSKAVDPDQKWEVDAPSVARLREAGAVLLGKTTTSEFGHKGVCDNPLTGITRNPWNPEMTPGGSSGGAGTATAAYMAPLNLGSDGGGSIRIPASFCGVVGFKPGFGVVPEPASITGPLVGSGPLTRSVADAALMMSVLARPDARNPNPASFTTPDFHGVLQDGVQGWRIGYLPTINDAPVEPEIAQAVAAGAMRFRELGATVEEASLSLPGETDIYITILSAGTALLLDRFTPEQQALMEPPLRTLAAMGRKVSGVDYARAYHQVRSQYIVALRALFARYDLLVLPSMPAPAFPVLHDYPGEQTGEWRADWTPFTHPFNLTSSPCCSIPCGVTRSGLPIGLQLVGPWGGDRAVLQAAMRFEDARGAFPPPSEANFA